MNYICQIFTIEIFPLLLFYDFFNENSFEIPSIYLPRTLHNTIKK